MDSADQLALWLESARPYFDPEQLANHASEHPQAALALCNC